MGNVMGHLFRVLTWGESHGEAVGAVLDGVPARLSLCTEDIQADLDRRCPAQSSFSSPRQESDRVSILSGVYEGLTLGTPIMLLVPNQQARSNDYCGWEHLYRPSHGDYTYQTKYGIRDPRGGGRGSARETVGRVAAGAVARQLLRQRCGVEVTAWVEALAGLTASIVPGEVSRVSVDSNELRCPAHPELLREMRQSLAQAKQEGDSVGGVVGVCARGVPCGWGEPVFAKLNARLAQALMSIPAAKGVEIGLGFAMASRRGSEVNDEWGLRQGQVRALSNNSGGIQGGISNGENIVARVAFKPVPTISKSQRTINDRGEEVEYSFKGRHDTCFVPRAVPIVEAMVALVLADCYLEQRARS